MKTAAFILIAAATWYMAGIYQYAPLMIVFIAELLLAGVMLLLPYRFRQQLTLRFSKSYDIAQKADSFPFYVLIENNGMLPVNHVQIGLKVQYPQFHTLSLKQRLSAGAAKRETAELEFELLTPYCGLLELQITEIKIYDCFSLFSVKKQISDTMRIAVCPPELALQIDISALQTRTYWDKMNSSSSGMENEIRQIREYQWGDSLRYVHWNQSARMEKLWIREYEQTAETVIDLLLDTASEHCRLPTEWSAFYEILSALVLGLLKKGLPLRIFWLAGHQDALQQFEVRQAGDCKELLAQLFQTEFCQKEEPFQCQSIQHMRFNLDLEWICGGKKIYQFSQAGYEKEMIQRQFILPMC